MSAPDFARLLRFSVVLAAPLCALGSADCGGGGTGGAGGSTSSGSASSAGGQSTSSSSASSSAQSSSAASGMGGAGGAGGSGTGTGTGTSSASSSAQSSSAASSSASSGSGGAGPVGVIVMNAGKPIALAVDASGLYWSDAGTGDVKHANLDGTNVTTLAPAAVPPAQFTGLALGKTDVFLAVTPGPGTGLIRQLPKGGGAVTDTMASPYVIQIVSLAGVPYWSDNTAASINTVGSTLIYGIGTPSTIAADASGIYWTEIPNNAIRRVSLDGSKVDTVAIMQTSAELGGVSNGLLFYNVGGTIRTIPMNGGAMPTDVVPGASPLWLTAAPTGVYWVENAPAMMPRPIKGLAPGAMMPSVIGTATETSSLAVGQGYVYWASGIDGAISREKEL